MAEFSIIDAANAPAPPSRSPRRLAERQRQYESYVLGVKRGQVGKLTPGTGESARGLTLRIARAARRSNRAIETWVADGAVYFKTGDR